MRRNMRRNEVMMKKFKALAWVALYMVIALGMQVVMAFSMMSVVYSVAFGNHIGGNSEIINQMYSQITDVFTKGSGAMILTALCDVMMLACFGLWYYFRENKYDFRPNYRAACTRHNIVSIVGIAIFGQFSVELLMCGIQIVFPKMMEKYSEVNDMLQLNTLPPVLMILIVCILGPLAEEMLFRGMIYGKLRRAFSIWPAAIISGLLFGLFHGNWVQGIYATLLGIILAYIYETTQTIWGSCLLHILFNASSYLLDWVTKLIDSSGSAVIAVIRLVIDVVSVIITLIIVKKFRTNTKKIEVQ